MKPSLREQAAEILAAAYPEWDISEECISPVSGFWKRVDVYRWQATFYLKTRYSNGDRILLGIGCWQKLKTFVRDAKKYGVKYEDGEVWSNEKP